MFELKFVTVFFNLKGLVVYPENYNLIVFFIPSVRSCIRVRSFKILREYGIVNINPLKLKQFK